MTEDDADKADTTPKPDETATPPEHAPAGAEVAANPAPAGPDLPAVAESSAAADRAGGIAGEVERVVGAASRPEPEPEPPAEPEPVAAAAEVEPPPDPEPKSRPVAALLGTPGPAETSAPEAGAEAAAPAEPHQPAEATSAPDAEPDREPEPEPAPAKKPRKAAKKAAAKGEEPEAAAAAPETDPDGPAAADPAAPAAAAESPAGAEPAPPAPESKKKWYVVKIQSGREDSIKAAIERKVKIEGLEEFFGQIAIPVEQFTEVKKVKEKKNGETTTKEKKVLKERKKFPGYLFAEVEFNDRILYLFRETSGVGDFVGATGPMKPPPPMSEREVQAMLTGVVDPALKNKGKPTKQVVKLDFEKGDKVKIRDGAFANMEGEVKSITEPKEAGDTPKVTVTVTIFGRPVEVELDYWHVDKA